MATGLLGWSPEVAWRTPIPELLIAMDAKIEWVQAFNPFGGGGKKKTPEKMGAADMRAALRGK